LGVHRPGEKSVGGFLREAARKKKKSSGKGEVGRNNTGKKNPPEDGSRHNEAVNLSSCTRPWTSAPFKTN